MAHSNWKGGTLRVSSVYRVHHIAAHYGVRSKLILGILAVYSQRPPRSASSRVTLREIHHIIDWFGTEYA